MTAPEPRPQAAVPNHHPAAEDLSFIRATMARAAPLTAVPGWGGVLMGLTATVAAWVASRQGLPAEGVAVWLAEAGLALGIGGGALVRKAQRMHAPGLAIAGRQFAGNFVPPVVAGALLTRSSTADQVRKTDTTAVTTPASFPGAVPRSGSGVPQFHGRGHLAAEARDCMGRTTVSA